MRTRRQSKPPVHVVSRTLDHTDLTNVCQRSHISLIDPSPLRLNELSATTTLHRMSNLRRHTTNYSRDDEICMKSSRLVNHQVDIMRNELDLTHNLHRRKLITHGNRYPASASLMNEPSVDMQPETFAAASCQAQSGQSLLPPMSQLKSFSHKHLGLITAVLLVCFISLTIGPATLSSQVQAAPDVQASTPSRCPLSVCTCKWSNGKQNAMCNGKHLQSIPMELPSETQVLDMSGNNLNQLPSHIFQERRLTNLQKLFLPDCKLSYIADEAFSQLTNLVELDLSHNHLQQVPTRALESLRYSLRKLNLAFNQIHQLDSLSFNPLINLNTLDLTHSQIAELRPNAFAGLRQLRELKLSENRLTQLPTSALVDVRDSVMIELYGNPWHCDCELRQSIDWMQQHNIQPTMTPTCASPPRHKDIRWQNVRHEDFMCPPVILTKPEEIVVGAGSNITLACSARGSSPLTFVWFQDEKNITGNVDSWSNQSDPAPSTKLLDERRYEIQEEISSPNVTTSILFLMDLKITDTSVFLCWVENGAGSTISNFSLIVNNSPPNHLIGVGSSVSALNTLGMSLMRLFGREPSLNDPSNAQIIIVLIVFLILLLLTVICLLILKHVISGPSSKQNSNSKSDFKSKHQMNGGNLSDNFANVNGGKVMASNGRMFASSDEDGITDEEDDDHRSSSSGGASSSGSQSSCAKNNTRLLAVKDLDGFFEHMRSGIIDIDHHSMSPAIQFNNTNTLKSQVKNQDERQLTQLNHFQTASNASSQQAYYGGQHSSNGSNSMATTISDLSPSSESASTSFANPAQNLMQQQHQHQMMANQRMLRHHPAITNNNCDHPNQEHVANYSGEYQGGYNEDLVAHQMMIASNPPMYTAGPELGRPVYPGAQMHHQHMMYPIGPGQGMVDVMIERDRFGNPLQQQEQPGPVGYPLQDPSAFNHIL